MWNQVHAKYDLKLRPCPFPLTLSFIHFVVQNYIFNDSSFRYTTIVYVYLELSFSSDKKIKSCIHLQYPPLFSGHCPSDSQTDREGSGFLSVVFWLLFCIHTSVCFRITGHSIRSHISESCNNNSGYGKLTCCLFSHHHLTFSLPNIYVHLFMWGACT